jgi:hypothetical protein
MKTARIVLLLRMAAALLMLLHTTSCASTKKFLKAKRAPVTSLIERNNAVVTDTAGSGP